MGTILSWIWTPLEARVLMVGLDNAGKTTILYQLKLGEVCTTVPTIGFNVENITYKGLTMLVWDIGGQTKIRGLWHHYYEGANAVVFVVDASDRDRFDLVYREFHELLGCRELQECVFLIFCNKIDLPGSLTAGELWLRMKLDQPRLNLKQKIHIVESNGKTGDGIIEGFTWLHENLKTRMDEDYATKAIRGYIDSLISS